MPAIENSPEVCPCPAYEPVCSGVDAYIEGYYVSACGWLSSSGVLAEVIDTWVGVGPASVGSAVDGTMAAYEAYYTDCGHVGPADDSWGSGVDAMWT